MNALIEIVWVRTIVEDDSGTGEAISILMVLRSCTNFVPIYQDAGIVMDIKRH